MNQTNAVVVWRGTLACGAREAEEFEAEIVIKDQKPAILRVTTFGREEVPAATIRAASWLPVLAGLAKRVLELEASR
jgi:hypothetical protein